MSESGEAVKVLLDRLEAAYGRTDWEPRFDPLDELVSCILSQHTNDKNSFPAFDRLRAQHPDWQEVVDLGPEHLASVIKSAGLANQKARSIIGCLNAIQASTGAYSLDFLADLPDDEARTWLLRLPGVGEKTAAIVLCFALGRDVVPVDTHVFRVAWRLGLIPKSAGESKAHALLDAIVPPGLAYRFHMALIRHGRAVCKAPQPNCPACPLTDRCAWFQAREAAA
ncbi:MAG TPA: endonuclease III [Fimbriimonas sp.]